MTLSKQVGQAERKNIEHGNMTNNQRNNHTAEHQFLKHDVRILGHIAGNGEIKMNPDKIKALMEYPRPTTARKLKHFLGLTSYYQKFFEGYSKIAFPILEILRERKHSHGGKKKRRHSLETL
jgi:hypothetical protein